MDSIIVGTAGHIDHGKTALVKALTGCDTDTLAEEKKRGISINLGFASFRLPNGRNIGIVDVPGHERFIKNMLAGATGIDLALIIIAATEGIMPQTREHIEILGYLGIQKYLIVLTKVDMVDEEFKELVVEDIRDFLKETFLAQTKIVEVDSISRKGLDTLIKELENLSFDIQERSFTKKPRMNVDRVFSIKGYGTVVTGTLMEGVIKVNDELTVFPQGISAKVRNLQVHDHNVEEAYAGQRTAINLSGLSLEELKRGNTVAVKDSVYVTNIIDVKFRIVADTKFELKKFSRLKLYVGSTEVLAKIVPITHKTVKAKDEGYAQIMLDHPIVVLKGDRFVLRTITPVTTIGGGIIIDPKPQRYKKFTEELIKSVDLKNSSSVDEIMDEYVKGHPFSVLEEIAAFINDERVGAELKDLMEKGTVIQIGKQYLHREFLIRFQSGVESVLMDYHKRNPLRNGMPKAELIEKFNLANKKQGEILLQYLSEIKRIKLEQNLVSTISFQPELTQNQQMIKEELLSRIHISGYSLMTIAELTENKKDRQQVLEFMLKEELFLLPGQYIMNRSQYEELKEQAKKLFTQKGMLKLSDFRDMAGTSRKFALLLLERFDQEKFTKRQGEDRIIV
ncbi:selenocysteine-specific translation elongation factor [Lacrimispora algidixylanolytica]|uniref:Selenocysteine-specific elongation factor n=1 Tax=Lacrimispora algidixylanolytica TaxID=94868 RepID=A0A419SVM4_9FIRM|nr:selenocysteine-specific translation elongation factor [Lacrimispora algidixylanolytica]RKD29283.1 selenocysteine-specific translation elongation factor [Lacrimispora algidixylanolytica]